ncbi:MAG: hypothetical protein JKY95_11165 [Planctomycetaceae bacterium]|nr:hypothetical protein [Planctomycetaceae bacterium]
MEQQISGYTLRDLFIDLTECEKLLRDSNRISGRHNDNRRILSELGGCDSDLQCGDDAKKVFERFDSQFRVIGDINKYRGDAEKVFERIPKDVIDLLSPICHLNGKFNIDELKKLRGKICIEKGIGKADVDAMPAIEFAKLFHETDQSPSEQPTGDDSKNDLKQFFMSNLVKASDYDPRTVRKHLGKADVKTPETTDSTWKYSRNDVGKLLNVIKNINSAKAKTALKGLKSLLESDNK